MRINGKRNSIILSAAFMFFISFLYQMPIQASAVDKNEVLEDDVNAETTENAEDSSFSEADLEDATRESAIAQILSQNPGEAQDAIRTRPEIPRTAYSKDVPFSLVTLNGIFSNTELYFYIPDYWEAKYVYVEIQYDVSQLIQGVTSSMTFQVNNVPISSCKVLFEEGDTQIAYIQIPMKLVKKGYNSFGIAAYARLYDGSGCTDDYSNANWLSIKDTSYIRCGYEIKPQAERISYYPYPFMSTIEETGKGLSIAVSDRATNGEIAAAMNIMADLSTETGKANNIEFCLLSDLKQSKAKRTILVSNYNNLTEEYKGLLSDTKNLEERAALQLTKDEGGNPLLIVTSLNDDCLLEAAYMLMDENRVSQEKGKVASVKMGSADVAINSTSLSQMVAGNYTVRDVFGSGLTFVGPFHQEQLIYLPFSEDYFLSDAGKITLNFRYSENLDFNRSLITVYWGNVPVASKRLEVGKAAGDQLTFAMPSDVVGTTTGAIRIAFDLEVKDMECTPRQEQVPWAYVSEESVLFLPASTGIVLTFDLKPSPFRTDGKFNDMMLVVSDSPTSDELNLYAQIIGMYGDGVEPYGTFYVKRASEFETADGDYNIITVGTYKENKLLQSLNENLYFAYNPSTGSFLSNEQLILSDSYARDIVILQLLESPFAENRGILAVTGATSENLGRLETFMRDYEMRYSLSKDCVVLDDDFEIKSFRFISTLKETEEPTLVGNIVKNKQSLLFTIVSTSVMLMLLIGIIIVLIRVKMYHKKKDE